MRLPGVALLGNSVLTVLKTGISLGLLASQAPRWNHRSSKDEALVTTRFTTGGVLVDNPVENQYRQAVHTGASSLSTDLSPGGPN